MGIFEWNLVDFFIISIGMKIRISSLVELSQVKPSQALSNELIAI